MTFEARDLPTQHHAAVRIAQVRVILCVLNFFVILLDQSIPSRSTLAAYFEAFTAGLLFFTYAVLAHEGLRTRQISLRLYQYGSPIFDVICASILIMVTNGYLSPFNLWFVFAVVASGFTSDRRLPYFATVLGVIALALIALIPQRLPLQASTFAVRAGYLFGFAAVLGALHHSLTVAGNAWASMDLLGRQLARIYEIPDVAKALFEALRGLAPYQHAALKVRNGETFEDGEKSPRHQETETYLVLHIGTEIAVLEVDWKRTISDFESSIVTFYCDRVASAIARIQISTGLVTVAAREERLRLADDLHDSYLQTLAAIDLHIEAIRTRTKSDPELDEGLSEIKRIARQAAKEAREAFIPIADIQAYGPEEIERLIQGRWAGTSETIIPENLELPEDHWRVLEMMVKEGLNNAAKHGRSSHVVFSIEPQQVKNVASLVQFGRPLSEEFKPGFGLTRLEEALSRVEGHMTLENLNEGGTVLRVALPKVPCKE